MPQAHCLLLACDDLETVLEQSGDDEVEAVGPEIKGCQVGRGSSSGHGVRRFWQTERPPSTPERNASIFSNALPSTLVSLVGSLRLMVATIASARSPAERKTGRSPSMGGRSSGIPEPVRQSSSSARGSPVSLLPSKPCTTSLKPWEMRYPIDISPCRPSASVSAANFWSMKTVLLAAQ